MSWFQQIWNWRKRINSISTPFGGFGWGNSPRAIEASETASPMPSLPEFSATLVRSYSHSTSGRHSDELLCIWTVRLQLTNVSPHDAFKLEVHIEGDTEITVQRPPAVIRSGESAELDLNCIRHFDRKEIHPSRYLPPSPEPQPRNINPLTERCPRDWTKLKLSVVYNNAKNVRYEQWFHREQGKEDMRAEPPISVYVPEARG